MGEEKRASLPAPPADGRGGLESGVRARCCSPSAAWEEPEARCGCLLLLSHSMGRPRARCGASAPPFRWERSQRCGCLLPSPIPMGRVSGGSLWLPPPSPIPMGRPGSLWLPASPIPMGEFQGAVWLFLPSPIGMGEGQGRCGCLLLPLPSEWEGAGGEGPMLRQLNPGRKRGIFPTGAGLSMPRRGKDAVLHPLAQSIRRRRLASAISSRVAGCSPLF